MDKRDCTPSTSVESNMCEFDDDDLLVAAFIQKRPCRSTNICPQPKNKHVKKLKSRKGDLSSHVGTPKTGPGHSLQRSWSTTGSRTVLSWLIHSGVISLNEVIQLWSPENDSLLKEGLASRDGIICLCCNQILSISDFKSHAGFRSEFTCMNLVLESRKPLVLCQLEAWSAEYQARKAPSESNAVDEGDDLCGICGFGGEFVWCDNCPATYHRACLVEQLPVGNWYCCQCRCLACWGTVNNKDTPVSPGTLKCLLCEGRYHNTCVNMEVEKTEFTSDNWFCGQSCYELYNGLQSRIGLTNHVTGEISWRLLRCLDGDCKAHSSEIFLALKAECNSKLAVAITLLENYFLQMVDEKTNIDMIPQVMYNRGSPFPRLNFEGFYTVVLEKNDVVVSVASIRFHGIEIAELPFVATCSKFRNQGMCRLLISSIEKLLKSLRVKRLVVPAATPQLKDMWRNKYGFEMWEEDHSKINLMLLPGSTWLAKPL